MRDDQQRLKDILLSIEDIQDFTSSLSEMDFLAIEEIDRMVFRAICNCVTTLGEAVKLLSPEITDKYPLIDWQGYAGMKNVFTHQYFRVQLDLLWNTIQQELPELKDIVVGELARFE